jgi:hypothetical protein
MDNVIPLFDPDAPLRGKAREQALERYREGVVEIVAKAVGTALGESCNIQGCANLSLRDVIPELHNAFRAAIDRPHL